MQTGTFDAVVIGGGPAGAAAAYTLAAAGNTVCLIDRAEFPRDKLCGGGLTFRSRRAFEAVFGRRWNAGLINSSRNFSFFSKGRFLAAYRDRATIYFTMRAAFDHYLVRLAQQAGATTRLGAAIVRIDLDGRAVLLRSGECIRFRCLIGADGVNSLVARTLFGRSFDPAQIAFALEAEVPREKLPRQGDLVEIDFNAARWGYGWVFPKRASLTIGIGGLHRRNPDLRDSLARYFRRKGLDLRDFKVKGQYLPGGETLSVPGRSNVLVCGDAAGAADPISGEGIPFALETGAAAAKAVTAALALGQAEAALDHYQARYDAIVAPFQRSRVLRRFIYPPVTDWIFAVAFRCWPIRRRVLERG